MFAKPMNVPNARVGAARTGQNYSGQPDPQGVSCDASLGACPPRGAITVLGFDITSINTQYTNITLPTGQTYAALTGWVQTQAVGTMGEFYLTARPKCKVIALALYFTPAVGNQIDIVAVGAGDKDSDSGVISIRDNGRLPGEGLIDASALLPMIAVPASPDCPLWVHGWTRGLQAVTQIGRGYFVVRIV